MLKLKKILKIDNELYRKISYVSFSCKILLSSVKFSSVFTNSERSFVSILENQTINEKNKNRFANYYGSFSFKLSTRSFIFSLISVNSRTNFFSALKAKTSKKSERINWLKIKIFTFLFRIKFSLDRFYIFLPY